MRTNLAKSNTAYKQYYVRPLSYKAEESKIIDDDFSIEKQTSAEMIKKKQDFEAEALPHMELLYNYAKKISADRPDADDLFQDTYLRAFRLFHKFEKGSNCKAWLFRIMKNCFINKYRKDKKKLGTVDIDDIQNFYDSIRRDVVAPHDLEFEIYSKLFDDEMTVALESLKDDYKTVLILCDIEGLSYEEIAEFIDCPVGTVRSRLFRGRKLLQEKLYQYALSRGYTTDNSFSSN